eukprot:11596506-Alexandrium_andersonii.AAC.1
MASASVQLKRSPSPRFQPTAFTPTATATTLASEMIHWSTSGGVGRAKRATGLVASDNGSVRQPWLLCVIMTAAISPDQRSIGWRMLWSSPWPDWSW